MAILFLKGGVIVDIFSKRLKDMRRDNGKTQEDMAKLLNIRRSTYGEYERGKIMPPVDKIKILADYFGVSVDFLMGNTNFKTHEERNESDPMDVSKQMKIILEYLENNQSVLTLDGNTLDDESREVLKLSLESGLKMAHILNKRSNLF